MKKFFKSTLALALSLIMVVGMAASGGNEIDLFTLKASAATVKSGFCGADIEWVFDDNGTLTLNGTGAMNNFYYSSMRPWDTLADRIETVYISEGITTIGENSFVSCSNLTSVTIPESVTTLEYQAFFGCESLKSITLPNSLNNIGERAFRECVNLETINIPDGVTNIGKYAFFECGNLKSLTIPDSVTTIGEWSFYLVNNVAYSENMIATGSPWEAKCANGYIEGDLIYSDSSKTQISGCFTTVKGSIAIPDSVTSIGDQAFRGCSNLENITFGENSSLTSIGEYAFYSCSSLKSINIPDGIESLGYYTFGCCYGLESVTFGENSSLKDIGQKAFYYCIYLKDFTIPDSVTKIDGWAFHSCDCFTDVTIPDSVTYIGECAFDGCDSLTRINVPDSVTSIGKEAFDSCFVLVVFCNKDSYTHTYCEGNGLDYYLVDDDSTRYINGSYDANLTWTIDKKERTLTINCNGEMPSFADNDAPWIEYRNYYLTATVENGCTGIGDNAFYGYSSLTSVTLPGGLTSIGNSAFNSCYKLTDVKIPDSVTSIGEWAFADCSILSDVILPDSVTTIGEGAFNCCYGFTNIAIPNSVTTINNIVFAGCSNITNITIPESVTSIGWFAIAGCESLTEVVLPYSVNTIGDLAFIECNSLDKIYIYNKNCSISEESFPENASIYGYTGSTAESFANENGFAFVAIDDTHQHVWSAWTITVKPTCTANGKKLRHCILCNKSENAVIPATGHKDTNKDGYCDVCKTVTNADLANPCRNAKINVASAKSVDYKAQVTIKATANGVPTGYSLAMYVNGKQVAKGSNTEVTYTVGQATSDINYTVKVIDAKGNVQKDSANKDLAKDGGKITVNSSFFAKIIAFFKSLFGSLSKVEVKP